MKKEEELRIRINNSLKTQFKDICETEGKTMSKKLEELINNEVTDKKPTIEENITSLLTVLKHPNITIVDKPWFNAPSCKPLNKYTSVLGQAMIVEPYNGDINKYLKDNKGKEIFLYLDGCNVKNQLFKVASCEKNNV